MTDDKQTEAVRVPCEVYSRIVGFIRPVQAWNAGKQAEWQDRVTFDVAQASPQCGHIRGGDDAIQ